MEQEKVDNKCCICLTPADKIYNIFDRNAYPTNSVECLVELVEKVTGFRDPKSVKKSDGMCETCIMQLLSHTKINKNSAESGTLVESRNSKIYKQNDDQPYFDESSDEDLEFRFGGYSNPKRGIFAPDGFNLEFNLTKPESVNRPQTEEKIEISATDNKEKQIYKVCDVATTGTINHDSMKKVDKLFPHNCSICDFKTTHHLQLIRHMSEKHIVQLYRCGQCKETFPTPFELDMHNQSDCDVTSNKESIAHKAYTDDDENN